MSSSFPQEVYDLYREDIEGRLLSSEVGLGELSHEDRLNVMYWIMYPCPLLCDFNGLLYLLFPEEEYLSGYPEYVTDMIKVYKFRLMIATKVYNDLPLTEEIEFLFGRIYSVLESWRLKSPDRYYTLGKLKEYDEIEQVVSEILGLDKTRYFSF